MPDHRTATTPAPARPRRKAWRSALKVVALLVVVGFAVTFVVQEWSGFVAGLRRLDLAAVVGAVVAIGVGLSGAMLAWRAVLTGLGSKLPVMAAARVFFLGQLGKYVPGSVWPIIAQAELSTEYGVPRSRAGLATLTQLLIGLVVGAGVAGGTLAFSSPEAFASYWWLSLVAVAGVVVLLPPVFNRLLALALRVTKRGEPEPVSGAAVLASAAWCLLMWVSFGVHLWLLARSIGADPEGLFLLATGAYALAWVVGFVIVVLPAGAGAREAALILALAPALPREDALAIALVSRFLMLVGDGLAAALAIAAEKLHTRRAVSAGRARTGSA